MREKTELMAFRLPMDLVTVIRARAVGEVTQTDVVVEMLRKARDMGTETPEGQFLDRLGEVSVEMDRAPIVRTARHVKAFRRGPRQKGDQSR